MCEDKRDGFEEMVKTGAEIAMRAAAAYLRKNSLRVGDYDAACQCLRSWLKIKIEEAGRMTQAAGNTISPAAMPTMRSAKRRASSTLCMLTITGMPAAAPRFAINSMISTEVFGSSDEVGSSASSKRGRCISARAMPTRWRWPSKCRKTREAAAYGPRLKT